MGIHWQELVIVLVIVLVLFGPRRLPEIGRSLGSGLREFKDSVGGSGGSKREAETTVAGLPAPSVAPTSPAARVTQEPQTGGAGQSDAVPAGASARDHS